MSKPGLVVETIRKTLEKYYQIKEFKVDFKNQEFSFSVPIFHKKILKKIERRFIVEDWVIFGIIQNDQVYVSITWSEVK